MLMIHFVCCGHLTKKSTDFIIVIVIKNTIMSAVKKKKTMQRDQQKISRNPIDAKD